MIIKICGGTFRGRIVAKDVVSTLRPTTSRNREMIFNILGDIVKGASFLDLYAGTGAVGFEALSRGATKACFVESDKNLVKEIVNHAEKFTVLDKCAVLNFNIDSLSVVKNINSKFDLLFVDPPYKELSLEILNNLYKLVINEGTLILESSSKEKIEEINGFQLIKRRGKGISNFSFFSRKD